MNMWSAFAIFAATAWDRLPRQWQLTGPGLVGIAGVAAGWLALWHPHFASANRARGEREDSSWTTWDALQTLPPSAWEILRPMLTVIAISLIVASIIAVYLATKRRPGVCLRGLAGAGGPVWVSVAGRGARMGPQFS